MGFVLRKGMNIEVGDNSGGFVVRKDADNLKDWDYQDGRFVKRKRKSRYEVVIRRLEQLKNLLNGLCWLMRFLKCLVCL